MSTPGTTNIRWRCSRCGKIFRTSRAGDQHVEAKHKGNGIALGYDVREREPPEPSMAEIAVEATIKRAMGEPLDPLEESLLP